MKKTQWKRPEPEGGVNALRPDEATMKTLITELPLLITALNRASPHRFALQRTTPHNMQEGAGKDDEGAKKKTDDKKAAKVPCLPVVGCRAHCCLRLSVVSCRAHCYLRL